ncbi:hypothetical protein LTS17_006833 [Exophiala oligosperma]
MPNLFFLLGPNGGPGAGSFIAMLEHVVEYIIKCISKLQREYISSMEVSETAHRAFSEHVDNYFARTIFTYKCKSWFKRNNEEGRIVGLWPGSSVHAQEVLKTPRFEDFEFVHMPETRSNIMNWLGNGLTTAQESDEKATAYLDNVDIPPVLNKGCRPRNLAIATRRVYTPDQYTPSRNTADTKAAQIENLAAAVATLPN